MEGASSEGSEADAHPYARLAEEEQKQNHVPRTWSLQPPMARVDSMQATSTFFASVVNLFKSIVGIGVVSLPAGIAAMCDDASVGLYPSLGLTVVLGAVNAYSFWVLGHLSLEVRRGTYAGVMTRVLGEELSVKMEALITTHCGVACLMVEIIIADIARDLARMCGGEGPLAQRAVLIVAIAAMVLAPLALLQSLAALAPFAALGTAGVLYTVVFMGIRLAQGAYTPDGEFYAAMGPEKPQFGTRDGVDTFQAFVLVSMLACAYVAHFNAPKFAQQLIEPTTCRLAMLCILAFLASSIVMGLVMCFGFLTFGGASKGLILNNYAVQDSLAVAARLATLVSVGASYPFVLVTFRDGLLQLGLKPEGASMNWKPSIGTRRVASVVLVALVTAVACVVTDLGFVAALVGAVLCSTIAYILPSLAFLVFLSPRMREGTATGAERLHYRANKVLLVFGIVVGLIGIGATCYGQVLKSGLWPEHAAPTEIST